MKKREAGMELLRIVAMLMIITLHYLDKGGILPQPAAEFTAVGYLAWGLEALCVPAVNVYVLISAYFLAESDYKPGKVMTLWLQVIFYSAGIPVVLLLTGILPVSQLNLYQIMNYIFPVIEEHYWFVTAYVLMYLLAPLMNGTLRELPAKTFRRAILLLLLLLSVSVSILPVRLPIDRGGYDALWFLCLYLVGAYLRFHGEKLKAFCTGEELRASRTAGEGLMASRTAGEELVASRTAGEGLMASRMEERLRAQRVYGWLCRLPGAGYLLCCLLIYASLCFVHGLYGATGSLADFISRQYQYNSIFCLLASLCLFGAFRRIRIPEGRGAALIRRAASASFGVYLIHEHLDMRYLWPEWLGAARFAGSPLFLLHWIVSVAAVYAVCMAVDLARQRLFALATVVLRTGILTEK